jgi:hypothetical protein
MEKRLINILMLIHMKRVYSIDGRSVRSMKMTRGVYSISKNFVFERNKDHGI